MNHFCSTFSPTKDSDTLDHLTLTILQKSMRTVYTDLKDCDHILDHFAKLSLDDLRNMTLWVYQMKQAASYTKEHLTDCGLYEPFVHKAQSNLLKIKIQSIHVRSTFHTLWLQFDCSNEQEPIQVWYCTCKVGAWVVGCCSRIAWVIWYLGFKRMAINPVQLQKCQFHEKHFQMPGWFILTWTILGNDINMENFSSLTDMYYIARK